MAEGSLLQRVTILPENVHRLRGELPPHEAAADYEGRLRAFFGAHPPQFDCILLGLGADGHTASLFPGTAALHETSRWVTANFVPHLDAWRLTVTLPLINQAHAILFLVEGQTKAEAVRATLAGPRDCTHYPAQCIQPSNGEVCWMLDAGSASALSPSIGS